MKPWFHSLLSYNRRNRSQLATNSLFRISELGFRISGFAVLCGCVMLMLTLALAVQAKACTNVVARHAQYGFTLQNTRGNVLPLAELWVYGPAARTSSQTCRQVRSSHPHRVMADTLGNQVLYFAFTNLPPYGVKIITVEADVDLTPTLPESAGNTETDVRAWLKPERFVEIEDPEFLRLAPSFGQTNTAAKAEAIFRWVSRNVKDDGYSAKDRGALYALREKKGDCTEFMYLFVALCRRAGIPARGLGGYVCPKNTIVRATDYHNWAEFYEGGRWHLVDPNRKVFMPRTSEYVATRVIGTTNSPLGSFGQFHFRGEGLTVKMN
jgi:transglutaminase-like putative cysteine protease